MLVYIKPLLHTFCADVAHASLWPFMAHYTSAGIALFYFTGTIFQLLPNWVFSAHLFRYFHSVGWCWWCVQELNDRKHYWTWYSQVNNIVRGLENGCGQSLEYFLWGCYFESLALLHFACDFIEKPSSTHTHGPLEIHRICGWGSMHSTLKNFTSRVKYSRYINRSK